MAFQDQISQAYQQYLGRAITPQELTWRQGQLGRSSLSNQIAEIANSAEATQFRQGRESTRNQSLMDFAAQQRAAQDALLNRQKEEQQGLFNQYSQKLEGQEKLPSLYSRLQTELGIPELSGQAQVFKNQIYNVKNMLDRLDEDVASRTRGSYTTEGARNRIVASEGGELRTELGRLGTGLEPVADMLSSAQGQLGTLLNLNMQQQNRELQPLEMQINALSDRFAREITGFNSSKETELTALLDKIERERELSDREWQLAQQLAEEERQYARQKSLAATQLNLNNTGNGGGQQTPAPAQNTPSWNDWSNLTSNSNPQATQTAKDIFKQMTDPMAAFKNPFMPR